MSYNRYDGLNPYLVSQVRYHAGRLHAHPAISHLDIEDIEQELMLDFLVRQKDFEPSKASWPTFVDRTLNYHCADLLDKARTQKRGCDVTLTSLECATDECGDIVPMLSDVQAHSIAQCDCQIALKQVLQHLPKDLALLLINLRTQTVTEISTLTDTSYNTLYSRLKKLRMLLIKNGFEKYLH